MEPINLFRLVPRPFAGPVSTKECSRLGQAARFGGLVVLLLIARISVPTFEQVAHAQSTQQPIAATMALEQHPACSDIELGGLDIDFGPFGTQHVPSPWRTNPEWKAIITDYNNAPQLQTPVIVEGVVSPPPQVNKNDYQASAEVAEEDIPWTHYTHDFTFKVIPDPAYGYVLSSYTRFPGETQPPIIFDLAPGSSCLAGTTFFADSTYPGGACYSCAPNFNFVADPSDPDPLVGSCVAPAETCPDGSTGQTCVHDDMEVEWDNGSLMDVSAKEGYQRTWGAVPEFVWPGVGDRIWVEGRWIFDCGHPGTPAADPNNREYVKFETEIHPPRALVTFRQKHPALDSFPTSRFGAPNFPYPQSYLPVTGAPVDPASLPAGVVSTTPTDVPLTEADIYVSVNGGGANDICSLVPVPCSDFGGHSGPFIDVNDRNYVFDIYPPGTNFGSRLVNGTYSVTPPVPDASLQWRIVDHSDELPGHACGGADTSTCVPVDPILICLIDSTTPPPEQTENKCPDVPAHPTRLRVILPFLGTHANYFAKSILVGWDDVPTPANQTPGVRTFKVTLHDLTVKDNGEGCCTDGDWRVFVNVGGQWRYISQIYDAKSDGTSVCNGADSLLNNGNNDCYQFDQTPWTVSVQDGTPIHVAVGGFVAREVEQPGKPLFMCHPTDYTAGCDAPTDYSSPLNEPFQEFGTSNDDRIGTYEFDLTAPDYAPPSAFTTQQFGCSVFSITGCSLRYQAQFNVSEIAAPTPPTSAPLVIGTPNYTGSGNIYFASATPMILQTADGNVEGFQYRFHRQGGLLPTYQTSPFPIHWTHADLATGVHSVGVTIGAAQSGDGLYDFQYSAESFSNLLEPRHTSTFVLDSTPPIASFVQPAATQYGHSDSIQLGYSVSDGSGSGVQSFTPKMDGQTATQFCGTTHPNCLDSGQALYLESMSLGTHTFSVDSVDNVSNAGTTSVTFTITVTFASLAGDVNNLQAWGCISNIGQSLNAKFGAAQNVYGKGQIQTAINLLAAALYEVQAQAGKHIATTCTDPNGRQFNPVDLLRSDIQYLEGILAGQLKANPVLGFVVNSANVAVYGATVNLMSGKTIIAQTMTDAAGFYYYADVSGLAPGGTYTVTVTLPKGFKSSTPSARSFTWSWNMVVGSFTLN